MPSSAVITHNKLITDPHFYRFHVQIKYFSSLNARVKTKLRSVVFDFQEKQILNLYFFEGINETKTELIGELANRK